MTIQSYSLSAKYPFRVNFVHTTNLIRPEVAAKYECEMKIAKHRVNFETRTTENPMLALLSYCDFKKDYRLLHVL